MRQEVLETIQQFSGQVNVITTPRVFVEFTGNFQNAILLNQIIYWQDKMKGDWLYKTYKTWEDELCMSEYQVRRATNYLKKEGLIETKIKKAEGNPTVHYKLKKDNFLDWFLKKLKERNTRNSRNETQETQGSLIKTINKDYNKVSFTKVKEEEETKVSSQNIKDTSYQNGEENKKSSRKVNYPKKKNILLQEEYSDILKLFSDNGMKLKLSSETKVSKYLYDLFRQLELGNNPYKKMKLGRPYEKALRQLDKKLTKKMLFKRIQTSLNKFILVKNDTSQQYIDTRYAQGVGVQGFFINPKTNKSWFLKYLEEDPTTNRDYIDNIQYDKVVKKFENMNFSYQKINELLYNNSERVNKFSKQQKKKFIFTVNNLLKWVEKNKKKLEQLNYPITPAGFLKSVGVWLQTQSREQPDFLEVNTPPWDWFNNWASENLDIDYRKVEEVVVAKKQRKKVTGKKVISEFMIEERVEQIMSTMSDDDIQPYNELVEIARKQLEKEIA